MKISKLIEQLESIKQHDGDIEVIMNLPFADHAIDFTINTHANNFDSPICYLFPDHDSLIWGMWTDHIKKLIKEERI